MDSGRGRGRGTDRGGRARARPAAPATNGTRKETTNLSVPTEESNAWDAQKKNDTEQPPTTTAPVEQPAAAPEGPKAAAPAGKTWASMLRQATAPKAPPKPKEPLNEKPAETLEPLPSADAAPAEETPKEPEPAPEAEPTTEPSEPTQETPAAPAANVGPSGEPLTESNLDQVDDTSRPTATDTAASTAADSWAPAPSDARTTTTQAAPPQPSTQTQPAPAVPGAGFAAVTPKMPAGRPQHYQRRILDQEEAVRMPGNREVDRAAVQFGAFSLGGAEEDIDGEREEAETRAQPPPESPVTHPRASLPPVTQPQAVDPLAAQKAAAATVPAAAPTGTNVPLCAEQLRYTDEFYPAPAAQVQAQQTTLPQGTYTWCTLNVYEMSDVLVANASLQRNPRFPPLSHSAVSAIPPRRALLASAVSTRARLPPRKRSLMLSRPSRRPSCPTPRELSARLPETSRPTTRRTTRAVIPTTTTASNMASTSSSSASRMLRPLLSRRSLSALSAATRTRLRPIT